MIDSAIDHRKLYRLLRTLPDTDISRLEPTVTSNLTCDGDSDITVCNDEPVWSCRLEELKQFGSFLRTMPRNGED